MSAIVYDWLTIQSGRLSGRPLVEVVQGARYVAEAKAAGRSVLCDAYSFPVMYNRCGACGLRGHNRRTCKGAAHG